MRTTELVGARLHKAVANGVRNRNSEQQNSDSFSSKNISKKHKLEQDVFDKAQVAEQVVNANNNEERRRKQKAMGIMGNSGLDAGMGDFLGPAERRTLILA